MSGMEYLTPLPDEGVRDVPEAPGGTPFTTEFRLKSSKLWLKIQHPLVADSTFKDIRDFTSIQVARKK